MTRAEIDRIAEMFAHRGYVPVPISEWREYAMATRIKATVEGNKVKPIDTTPKPLRAGKKAKADREEAAWRGEKAQWARDGDGEYTGTLGSKKAFLDKIEGFWDWKIPNGPSGRALTFRAAKAAATEALKANRKAKSP